MISICLLLDCSAVAVVGFQKNEWAACRGFVRVAAYCRLVMPLRQATAFMFCMKMCLLPGANGFSLW